MKYRQKLSDIAEICVGFPFRSSLFNQNDEGFRLIRGKNVGKGFLRWGKDAMYYADTETVNKNYIMRENDVVLAMDGNVVENKSLVRKRDLPSFLVQRVARLRAKDGIDQLFLWYLVNTHRFEQYLNGIKTGTTIQHISAKQISDFRLNVPDLETQQKIVRILSALDQKIELNNQQSKVLETAAFTLYDDLINNIDESDFKRVAIGQIADCKLGGTPSRAKTEYWGGSINWINSGAINSFRITGPSELITEEGFKHTSTYMLPKGTTVLAITGATLGQVSRMEIEGCANQSVIGIVGNNAISNEYIYLTIVRNIQEIINRQTGGAQQHINKNDIKEFEIILPNQQLMNNFTNKVRPFFEKIAQNEFENKTLSSLRDAILPELMSGEINLNEATINEQSSR